MDADREHVISVVLKHDDWKEFVKLQPQPAVWLRERIQEMIAAQAALRSQAPDPRAN
jgi:hypothetical protein